MTIPIPKTLIQTSPTGIPAYVNQMSLQYCLGWEYNHFSDADIYQFFADNPTEEFPNIKTVFDSFSHGAHRADLFRYYYLYLKGGVYLDSDAVLEAPIDDIISGNSFVSINSYHTNAELLFNGFIAVTPKHEIMHAALKDAYKIKDDALCADYHQICKNLYSITQSYQKDDMLIYQEERSDKFRAGVRTYNKNRQLLLTHFCYVRLIPKAIYKKGFAKAFYKFIFSYKLLFKLHRIVQKIEIKLMNRNYSKVRQNK